MTSHSENTTTPRPTHTANSGKATRNSLTPSYTAAPVEKSSNGNNADATINCSPASVRTFRDRNDFPNSPMPPSARNTSGVVTTVITHG